LVFLDPPYRKELIPRALASLHDGEWLAPGAIIVAEMAEEEPIPETPGFRQLDERIYGTTRVLFLTHG
jgi:16S rRNA (guanine966-N2)-methyltransferase